MKELFQYDSLIVRIFSQIANIAIVNFLCLLCCIPVVTAGTAITAMYYVFFKNITGEDDAALKPFLQVFRRNLHQSTCIWLPVLLVMIVLFIDAMYLIANWMNTFHFLWPPFLLLALIVGIIHCFVFPLIARYQCTLKEAIQNAIVLFFQNLLSSTFILIMNILPWAMALLLPDFFLRTSLFWLFFGTGGIAYCNSWVLLRIFNKYAPEDTI